MILIKKVGNRYYKEDRTHFRSFPIKKIEAEKLLAEGKAKLIKYFTWEQIPEEEYNNVINLNEVRKKKEEDKKLQELILKFKNEYLPYLTQEEVQKIINTKDRNEYTELIVKACLRIDLERQN